MGQWPAISTTARPADKGTGTERVDPAIERRTITALVELSATAGTPLRRSDARQIVRSRLAAGQTLAEVEAYLRATFRHDPTGVTAVRNVMRGGGPRAVS